MDLSFLQENWLALQEKTLEHISLTAFSLLIASAIAIPLGILIARLPQLRSAVLKIGSVSQTLPSLAILGFLVPFMGLGVLPTIVVLTFYAWYPILRSTYTGLEGILPEYKEAAIGLGFSSFQRLWYVELPLAMPVIIAGLRVATASTIGITTIAAFIGAGGLGDFIMQGLAMNDPSLILLGAIPAALLALLFDWFISHLENTITTPHSPREKKVFFGKGLKVGISFLVFALLLTPLIKEAFVSRKDTIVIASKNFTEQYILAELMAQLIEENTSLKVIRKLNLGTTDILHQALLKGKVDLYPEYSGTAYMTVLKLLPEEKEKDILPTVSSLYQDKFQLKWLEPFGFTNSHVLAMNKELAVAYGINTLSDLAKQGSQFSFAATPEYLKRDDGVPGLKKVYHLNFRDIMQISPNLLFSAAKNDKVDVIEAFETDGRLLTANFVPLKDDKDFNIAYQAAPVIRESVLEQHPEIKEALMPLFGSLDNQTMTRLNSKVDVDKKSPYAVAREYINSLKKD